jgi:hypothetical protein
MKLMELTREKVEVHVDAGCTSFTINIHKAFPSRRRARRVGGKDFFSA